MFIKCVHATIYKVFMELHFCRILAHFPALIQPVQVTASLPILYFKQENGTHDFKVRDRIDVRCVRPEGSKTATLPCSTAGLVQDRDWQQYLC